MAIAVQIADSLAAALSSHSFSIPVSASRLYVPDYQGHELQTMRVSVVPGPVEAEKSTRGQDLFTHSVMVMVAQATDGSNEQLDPLMHLCEEIIDSIRSGTVSSDGMPQNAKYYGSTFSTVFDRDAINDRRVFIAQIEVSYRVPRDYVVA